MARSPAAARDVSSVKRRQARQPEVPTSGFPARHSAPRLDRSAAGSARSRRAAFRQAELPRAELVRSPAGRRAASGFEVSGFAVSRSAQPAASSSVAVRARVLARVPAGVRRPAEMAAWGAVPHAARAAVAAQPDAEAVAEVVRPDAAVAAEAEPDVAAEAAALDVAAAGAAAPRAVPGGPAAARPSEAVVWLSLLPFAPRRSMSTARAMGCSSVAWPKGPSWQATQFSDVSCALGPGENSKVESWRRNASDQSTSVRPECGGFQTETRIYFAPLRRFDARLFTPYSGPRSDRD